MLGVMSVKKKVFKPLYRLFPSSLEEKFSSGELDVKALFLVSELSYEVLKREGPQRHLPQDRNRDFLRGTLSNSYRTVVEGLKDAGVIQVRLSELGKESYSTEHHHSKQYSLTKKYRDELIQDGVSGMLITDHRQLKRIYTFFSRSTENLLKEHDWLKAEVEALKRLNFQKDLADRFLKEIVDRQEFRGEPLTQGVHQALRMSINNADIVLNSDHLPHVKIKHGRVFHKLVNVHKEFRDFITTNTGEKLVELDMKSAQWVMLCKALAHKQKHNYTSNLIEELIKHIDSPIDILATLPDKSVPIVKEVDRQLTVRWTPADAHHFARTVFFDDIYTELGLLKSSTDYAILSGRRHPNRSAFKEESIAESLYNYFTNPEQDVLHGDWDVRHIRSVLIDNYPTVYSFLRQCAQESTSNKRSRDLATLMQNYEGFFFHRVLQEALKSVLEGHGYIIIHDAAFVPESKAEEALHLAKKAALDCFGDDQMFSL